MASSTVNSAFNAGSTSASESLAQNWWLFLLRGTIAFGVALVILSIKLRSRQYQQINRTVAGTAA